MPDLIITKREIPQETVDTILKTAHSAGILVLLNASPASVMDTQILPCITHLIVNRTEAAMLYGCGVDDLGDESWEGIARLFLKSGAQNVVVTLGANGASYAMLEPDTGGVHHPGKLISGHVSAITVPRDSDPTGA